MYLTKYNSMSNSWRPAVRKNNKFEDIPTRMNTYWNKSGGGGIGSGRKSFLKKGCVMDKSNFPKLMDDSNFPKLSESSKPVDDGWIKVAKTEGVQIVEKKIVETESIKKNEWTDEDTIDEYFELKYSDIIHDINDEIKLYCSDKLLPFYDSYSRVNNLVDLIKNSSTEYDNMFTIADDDEEEEELEDDELM
jgi:hypothetical protein